MGRAPTSALQILERSVSRQHAMLSINDDAFNPGHSLLFSVVDLESDNGTAINGMDLVPGTPHGLRSGDVVAFGDVVFVFLDSAAFFNQLPVLAGG